MCPRNKEGLVWLQQRFKGKRPGWVLWPFLWVSWKFGHWGGVVRLFPIALAAVFRIDLGQGPGGSREAVAREG